MSITPLGAGGLPFAAVADTEQRAVLCAALEDICLIVGIEAGSSEHDEAANFVMQFYGKGYRTADGPKSAFDRAIRLEPFG